MAKAVSTVQVSITSQLGQGFSAAFQTADARMRGLRQSVSDTARVVGNIDAFRRQADVVKQAGYSWQAAKAKADQFREAINAQGAPTKRQTAELAKLEAAAGRAGDKFAQQRERLAEMGRELQRAGVHTGKLSAEYERLKAQLDATKAKHDRMEQSLARQQRIVSAMGTTWKGIAGAAAGVTAAGAVLAGPTRKAMTYDQQLSYMADTAAAGKGPEAYRQSKTEISNAIDAALKAGGGKREDAATALQTLIASGKFTQPEALAQLKDVTRTAFASGASSEDIAKTVIALKNFGIANPGAEMDKLLRAGQLGNFELKDMAKSLPQQLALGRASGMSGTTGLTELLAFNQVAMKTAGTPEEAGNNVVNLLQKFSGRDFAKSMADNINLRPGDPYKGSKKGKKEFDWAGYAIKQREQGVGAIDAFAMLLERQLAGDKRYQGLQKRIGQAGSDEEKKSTLEAMASIAEGSELGKLIADRQALMAALASLYGRKEMVDLRTGIDKSQGAVDQSSANIRGDTWAKAVDAQNALSRANEQTYNQLSGPLGKVLETANGLAEKFPGVTAGAYAAGTALSALAAGIAGSAIWGLLTRGGGAAAAAGGVAAAGTVGASAGASAAGTAAGSGALAGALRLAGPMGLLAGLANATTAEEDAVLEKSAQAERAKLAALTQQYGRDTLDKAYKAKAPWYQFGGVDNAQPDRVEAWVKAYLADKPAAAGAAGAPAPAVAPAAARPAPPDFSVMAPQNQVGPNPMLEVATQSSTAASNAAKAAAEAATAAQSRPNVQQTNNYNVTVQTPAQPGAAELGDALNKALRERERQKDADLRGSFLNQPKF